MYIIGSISKNRTNNINKVKSFEVNKNYCKIVLLHMHTLTAVATQYKYKSQINLFIQTEISMLHTYFFLCYYYFPLTSKLKQKIIT